MSEITKDEARAALRSVAFHDEEEDRDLVHCILGFTGADWDLDDALRAVDGADVCLWLPHFAHHDLCVVGVMGLTFHFNARMPEEDA